MQKMIASFFIFVITVLLFSCGKNKSETTQAPAQQTTTQQDTAAAQPQQSSQSVSESAATTNRPTPHFRMPAYWEDPDAAGPLAPTLDPATVPPEARAAYLIAQQEPKLLAQMPCFCYCDRFGHQSLHDCYVSTHAEHCEVCLKEAIEADQMEKQGMTPQEIRSLIVAKYHPPS